MDVGKVEKCAMEVGKCAMEVVKCAMDELGEMIWRL